MIITLGASSAFAVSDGYYDPSRMLCTEYSNTTGAGAVPGCYDAIIEVADSSGHIYFGAGARQVDLDEQPAQTFDVWVDPGQGVKYTFTVSRSPAAITGPQLSPGTPAQPQQGVFVYFGADDNLENGEHDGSPLMHNGPSDGGGIAIDIRPETATAWVNAIQRLDVAHVIANPIPVAGAGLGGCADGICFGSTAVRRVAYLGGATDGRHRDAPNYAAVTWDPESCDGEDDGVTKGAANACDDPATPQINCTLNPLACNTQTINGSGYENILYWHMKNGPVYLEPGLNIYEDPDPQASPIGPYPLPALSLGTCGFVFGGAAPLTFTGPSTNSAGQIVVATLCN
ncbi:MAG: hypothetical protein E6J87_00675 [Deltaproteobacteria bacterium]|nr:MAG: hypothetical protein E6J87_00675 [Deltaproteobacteria bacterium]